MDQHTVYLSIGSNRDDKLKNLDDAITILGDHNDIRLVSVSSFYKTEPQNFRDQDWFVNAALKIETGLLPKKLLQVLQAVEKTLDKEGKAFRFGPRIIDLDIIYYGKMVLKTKDLEIPHPRMHERCFVLYPICDIGADVIHPVLNCRSDELLEKINEQAAQEVILLSSGHTLKKGE